MTTAKSEINLMRVFQGDNKPGSAIRFVASPNGRGRRLETVQFLPQPLERVFQFFADAHQLETITPPWLHFSVLTQPPIQMAENARIDYRLRLHGVPLRWQSLISAWEPPFRFVDEQVLGPYRRWHHEHRFEPADGGTLCRDIVDYEVPGGALVDALWVRPDLRRIFRFRSRKLEALFGSS
jgi:ligand-binding SRPBCC domain-containing protein